MRIFLLVVSLLFLLPQATATTITGAGAGTYRAYNTSLGAECTVVEPVKFSYRPYDATRHVMQLDFPVEGIGCNFLGSRTWWIYGAGDWSVTGHYESSSYGCHGSSVSVEPFARAGTVFHVVAQTYNTCEGTSRMSLITLVSGGST